MDRRSYYVVYSNPVGGNRLSIDFCTSEVYFLETLREYNEAGYQIVEAATATSESYKAQLIDEIFRR